MKSFNTFLQEDLAWQESANTHIIKWRIPLSSRFVEKVFKPKRVIGYHVTDYPGLKRLLAIQGTNKSISCYPSAKPANFEPVQTYGGIVVQVVGNVIFSFDVDVMTRPDNTGIRWLNIRDFEIGIGRTKDINAISSRIQDEMIEMFPDEVASGKRSSKFISVYMKKWEDAFSAMKTALEDYRRPSENDANGELLLDRIEVKKVLSIHPTMNYSFKRKPGTLEKMLIRDFGKPMQFIENDRMIQQVWKGPYLALTYSDFDSYIKSPEGLAATASFFRGT